MAIQEEDHVGGASVEDSVHEVRNFKGTGSEDVSVKEGDIFVAKVSDVEDHLGEKTLEKAEARAQAGGVYDPTEEIDSKADEQTGAAEPVQIERTNGEVPVEKDSKLAEDNEELKKGAPKSNQVHESSTVHAAGGKNDENKVESDELAEKIVETGSVSAQHEAELEAQKQAPVAETDAQPVADDVLEGSFFPETKADEPVSVSETVETSKEDATLVAEEGPDTSNKDVEGTVEEPQASELQAEEAKVDEPVPETEATSTVAVEAGGVPVTEGTQEESKPVNGGELDSQSSTLKEEVEPVAVDQPDTSAKDVEAEDLVADVGEVLANEEPVEPTEEKPMEHAKEGIAQEESSKPASEDDLRTTERSTEPELGPVETSVDFLPETVMPDSTVEGDKQVLVEETPGVVAEPAGEETSLTPETGAEEGDKQKAEVTMHAEEAITPAEPTSKAVEEEEAGAPAESVTPSAQVEAETDTQVGSVEKQVDVDKEEAIQLNEALGEATKESEADENVKGVTAVEAPGDSDVQEEVGDAKVEETAEFAPEEPQASVQPGKDGAGGEVFQEASKDVLEQQAEAPVEEATVEKGDHGGEPVEEQPVEPKHTQADSGPNAAAEESTVKEVLLEDSQAEAPSESVDTADEGVEKPAEDVQAEVAELEAESTTDTKTDIEVPPVEEVDDSPELLGERATELEPPSAVEEGTLDVKLVEKTAAPELSEVEAEVVEVIDEQVDEAKDRELPGGVFTGSDSSSAAEDVKELQPDTTVDAVEAPKLVDEPVTETPPEAVPDLTSKETSPAAVEEVADLSQIGIPGEATRSTVDETPETVVDSTQAVTAVDETPLEEVVDSAAPEAVPVPAAAPVETDLAPEVIPAEDTTSPVDEAAEAAVQEVVDLTPVEETLPVDVPLAEPRVAEETPVPVDEPEPEAGEPKTEETSLELPAEETTNSTPDVKPDEQETVSADGTLPEEPVVVSTPEVDEAVAEPMAEVKDRTVAVETPTDTALDTGPSTAAEESTVKEFPLEDSHAEALSESVDTTAHADEGLAEKVQAEVPEPEDESATDTKTVEVEQVDDSPELLEVVGERVTELEPMQADEEGTPDVKLVDETTEPELSEVEAEVVEPSKVIDEPVTSESVDSTVHADDEVPPGEQVDETKNRELLGVVIESDSPPANEEVLDVKEVQPDTTVEAVEAPKLVKEPVTETLPEAVPVLTSDETAPVDEAAEVKEVADLTPTDVPGEETPSTVVDETPEAVVDSTPEAVPAEGTPPTVDETPEATTFPVDETPAAAVEEVVDSAAPEVVPEPAEEEPLLVDEAPEAAPETDLAPEDTTSPVDEPSKAAAVPEVVDSTPVEETLPVDVLVAEPTVAEETPVPDPEATAGTDSEVVPAEDTTSPVDEASGAAVPEVVEETLPVEAVVDSTPEAVPAEETPPTVDETPEATTFPVDETPAAAVEEVVDSAAPAPEVVPVSAEEKPSLVDEAPEATVETDSAPEVVSAENSTSPVDEASEAEVEDSTPVEETLPVDEPVAEPAAEVKDETVARETPVASVAEPAPEAGELKILVTTPELPAEETTNSTPEDSDVKPDEQGIMESADIPEVADLKQVEATTLAEKPVPPQASEEKTETPVEETAVDSTPEASEVARETPVEAVAFDETVVDSTPEASEVKADATVEEVVAAEADDVKTEVPVEAESPVVDSTVQVTDGEGDEKATGGAATPVESSTEQVETPVEETRVDAAGHATVEDEQTGEVHGEDLSSQVLVEGLREQQSDTSVEAGQDGENVQEPSAKVPEQQPAVEDGHATAGDEQGEVSDAKVEDRSVDEQSTAIQPREAQEASEQILEPQAEKLAEEPTVEEGDHGDEPGEERDAKVEELIEAVAEESTVAPEANEGPVEVSVPVTTEEAVAPEASEEKVETSVEAKGDIEEEEPVEASLEDEPQKEEVPPPALPSEAGSQEDVDVTATVTPAQEVDAEEKKLEESPIDKAEDAPVETGEETQAETGADQVDVPTRVEETAPAQHAEVETAQQSETKEEVPLQKPETVVEQDTSLTVEEPASSLSGEFEDEEVKEVEETSSDLKGEQVETEKEEATQVEPETVAQQDKTSTVVEPVSSLSREFEAEEVTEVEENFSDATDEPAEVEVTGRSAEAPTFEAPGAEEPAPGEHADVETGADVAQQGETEEATGETTLEDPGQPAPPSSSLKAAETTEETSPIEHADVEPIQPSFVQDGEAKEEALVEEPEIAGEPVVKEEEAFSEAQDSFETTVGEVHAQGEVGSPKEPTSEAHEAVGDVETSEEARLGEATATRDGKADVEPADEAPAGVQGGESLSRSIESIEELSPSPTPAEEVLGVGETTPVAEDVHSVESPEVLATLAESQAQADLSVEGEAPEVLQQVETTGSIEHAHVQTGEEVEVREVEGVEDTILVKVDDIVEDGQGGETLSRSLQSPEQPTPVEDVRASGSPEELASEAHEGVGEPAEPASEEATPLESPEDEPPVHEVQTDVEVDGEAKEVAITPDELQSDVQAGEALPTPVPESGSEEKAEALQQVETASRVEHADVESVEEVQPDGEVREEEKADDTPPQLEPSAEEAGAEESSRSLETSSDVQLTGDSQESPAKPVEDAEPIQTQSRELKLDMSNAPVEQKPALEEVDTKLEAKKPEEAQVPEAEQVGETPSLEVEQVDMGEKDAHLPELKNDKVDEKQLKEKENKSETEERETEAVVETKNTQVGAEAVKGKESEDDTEKSIVAAAVSLTKRTTGGAKPSKKKRLRLKKELAAGVI